MSLRTFLFLAPMALGLAAALPARAAEAVKTQQCIEMSAVDHTTVIDGQTILVTMKRRAFKRIDLVERCLGLATEQAFSFGMQTYELCRSTPLHVLNGGTCIIDKIVDIDAVEAKALGAKK